MAESHIIKGTTKSGINYSIDERVLNDARIARKMAKLNNPDVKDNPMESVSAWFDFLDMIFGEKNLNILMDEIAARNDGICPTETLMAEAQEIIDAVSPKN